MPFNPTGFKRKRDEEEREKQWQRPTSQARVPKKTVVAQKIAAAKDKETAAPKTRKTPVPARKDEVKDISSRIARKAGERPINRLTRSSQNSAPRIESAGTVIDTPNGPVTVTKVSPYSFAEHGLYYRALHGQELPKDASKLTEADLKALNDDGYRYETLMDYDLAGNQKRLDEMVTAEMRRTGKTRVSTPEIEKLRAEVNDAKLVQDYEASEKRKTELGLWNLGQKQQEIDDYQQLVNMVYDEATRNRMMQQAYANGGQEARLALLEEFKNAEAKLAEYPDDYIKNLKKDLEDAKVIQYNNRGNDILAALETALGDAYEGTMRVAVNPAPNWDVAPGYDPYDYLTDEEKQLVGMQGVTAEDLAAGRYEQQQADMMAGARTTVEAKLKELGITDWSAKEVFDYYKNTEMERGLKANAAALQKAVQKHPAAAAALSLTAPFLSVMSGLGSLDALGQKITHPDRPVNFYSAADAASLYHDTITGATSQQIHDAVKNATGSDLLAGAASFGYNAGESILDNGVRNLLVLGGVPPTASLGIMATGAASSSMRMAHERGLSDEQVLTLGVISGMTEYATEKIGLDEFLNTIGKAGKSRTFMQNLWRNTLAEGGEEGISGVVGVWADVIVAQDESEWRKAIDSYRLQGYSDKDALTMALFDQANEIGLDMLAGGLSGGVMGGTAHISNQTQENRAQNLVNVASVASQIAGVSEDLTPLENAVAQQAVDLMSSSKKGDKSKAVTAVMQSKEAQQALGLDFADGTSVTEKRTAIKEALTQRANVETAAAAGKAAEELIALQQEISGAEELSDKQRGAYSDAVNTLQDAVDRMDPETRKQAKSVVRQAAQIQKVKAKEMKAAEKQAGEMVKQAARDMTFSENDTVQNAAVKVASGEKKAVSSAVSAVLKDAEAQQALGLDFKEGMSNTDKRTAISAALAQLVENTQTQAVDEVAKQTEEAEAQAEVPSESAAISAEEELGEVDERYLAEEAPTYEVVEAAVLEENPNATQEEIQAAYDADMAEYMARSTQQNDDSRQGQRIWVANKNGKGGQVMTYAQFEQAAQSRATKSGTQFAKSVIQASWDQAVVDTKAKVEEHEANRRADLEDTARKANETSVFKNMGYSVRVSYDDEEFKSENVRVNAFVNPGTKEIVFNGNVMESGAALLWYMGHEVTHKAAEVDRQLVDNIIRVFSELNKEGKLTGQLARMVSNMDTRIKQTQRLYQAHENERAKRENREAKTISEDAAKEEVAADLMRYAFQQTKLYQDIVGKDAGLAVKMRQAVSKMLKAMTGDGRKNSAVQKRLQEIADQLDKALEKYDASQDTDDQPGLRYSITSCANAAGLEAIRDGTTGEIYFLLDGEQVNHVTAEHIRDHSAFGAMIRLARDGVLDENGKRRPGLQAKGTITTQQAKEQFQAVADLMNLIMSTQNPDMVWAFAGSQLFSAIKTNSDGQYSTTVDFTTVCRKTADMIQAMSTAMMERGRGLTKAEVTQLQADLVKAGLQVPCPVCYVFSRWAGIGTILDRMRQFQDTYADMSNAEIEARIEEMKAKSVKELRKDLRRKLAEEDDAYMQLAAQREGVMADRKIIKRAQKQAEKKGDAAEIERLAKELKLNIFMADGLKKQMDDMVKDQDVFSQELSWLQKVRVKSDYAPVPTDILFDMTGKALPKTGDNPNGLSAIELFMTKYKPSWSYRTGRGPSAGKAILPYADMRVGDFIMPIGSKSSDNKKDNPFANPLSIHGAFNEAQNNAVLKAIARVRAQNLIGGQRFQSTSDFRYDYALDYIQTFFEAQALGSCMQTYTKIIEFAEMVARIGGDVNISAMPKNKGYTVDENGKPRRLLYSHVTGVNMDAAKTLIDQYDSAQVILVGINDDHIRLALEDSEETGGIDIGFVIPYHTSGASIEHFIKELVRNLNEDFVRENYQDYSDVQTDHAKGGATQDQLDRRALRRKILTGLESYLDDDGKRKNRAWIPSAEELAIMQEEAENRTDILGRSFEDLLDVETRALNGDADAIREYESWTSGYLFDLYTKMWTKDGSENGVRLAGNQADAIMPHEYWNKSTTRSNAYINGFLFRSYCYNMGLNPRFTGMNSKGKRVDHGDFRDCTGYWKTLIDRAMYNNDGTYRDQKQINLSELPVGSVEARYGEENWAGFKVAEPQPETAERVGQEFAEKTGGDDRQFSIAYEHAASDSARSGLQQAQDMLWDYQYEHLTNSTVVPVEVMEDIRDKTGWWRSPTDNKWRYWISDAGATWNADTLDLASDTGEIFKLYDVIKHDRLFRDYPQLEDVDVMFYLPEDGSTQGEFRINGNQWLINLQANAELNDETFSTLLHEIQHAIQQIEVDQGSSVQNGSNVDVGYKQAFVVAYNDITNNGQDTSAFDGLSYKQAVRKIEQRIAKLYRNSSGFTDAERQRMIGDGMSEKDVRDWEKAERADRSKEDIRGAVQASAYEYYREAIGEVDARFTGQLYQMGRLIGDPDMAAETNLQDRVRYGEETRRGDYASVRYDAVDYRRISRKLGWDGKPEHLHSSNYDLAESRGSQSKYWHPKLAQTQWDLLHRRLYTEASKNTNYLDESTKWVYADQKGTKVFALYGVGDPDGPTILYAVGGAQARKQYERIKDAVEEINNGTVSSREGLDRIFEALPAWAKRNRDYYATAYRSGSAVRDVRVSTRQSESNRPGDRGRSEQDSRASRALGQQLNTDTEASEESDASSVDRQYSLDNPNDVGYTAGDLGKSRGDGYWNMKGRGTGHFGTGTYFVGDKALISDSHYGKRPVERADFAQYNLFRPRNADQGYELHEELKKINDNIEQLPDAMIDFDEYWRAKHDAEDALYDAVEDPGKRQLVLGFIQKYDGKYAVDRIYENAQKLYDDIHFADTEEARQAMRKEAEDFRRRFEEDHPDKKIRWAQTVDEEVEEQISRKVKKAADYADDTDMSVEDLMFHYGYDLEQAVKLATEKLDALRTWYSRAGWRLQSALGYKVTEAQVQNALQKTYDTVQTYTDRNAYYDSASTVFMKALGYEGIDVRGIKGLDNTTYGSVIYDLKGEDLARKKEIGTAKYSVSPADQTDYDPNDDPVMQAFFDAYEEAQGEGQTEKDYPTLEQRLRAAERAQKKAEKALESEQAKRSLAEGRAQTISKEANLAWTIYTKKRLREQRRMYQDKLNQARRDKLQAVEAAVRETRELERARADVRVDREREKADNRVKETRETWQRIGNERVEKAREQADKRVKETRETWQEQARKRLGIQKNAYEKKLTKAKDRAAHLRENLRLQSNAGKVALRNKALNDKKRAENEEETSQAPIDTIRKMPDKQAALKRLSDAAHRLRTKGRKAYAQFVSKAAPLERFSGRQKSVVKADILATIYGGTDTTVENIFKEGLVNRSGDRIGDSFADVFLCTKNDKGKVIDENKQALLQDYMLHRHNIARMGIEAKAKANVEAFEEAHPELRDMSPRDFGLLLSLSDKEAEKAGKAEAKKLAKQYQALISARLNNKNKAIFADEAGQAVTAETSREVVEKYERENPWLREKADAIYKWWDLYMRTWVVGDLMSEEQYNYWKNLYPDYVPTYRVGKPGLGAGFGRNTIAPAKVDKRATGSFKEVVNIEDSFANLIQRHVNESRKNELLKNITDTAMMDNDGLFGDFAYFAWDEYAEQNDIPIDAISDLGVNLEEREKLGLEQVGKDYRITAMYNGVPASTYVSKEMYDSLSYVFGLVHDRLDTVARIGGMLTRPMKTAITGINPVFMLRNVMRDIPTAIINSQATSFFGVDYMYWWFRAWGNIALPVLHGAGSKQWQNYVALGGTNSMYYNQEGGFAKNFNMKPGAKGLLQRGWNNVKTAAGWMNETIEQVTRFAEYLATVKKYGDTYENRLRGIKNAAEVTVDFSRHGEYGQAINNWIPYWNPAVQGIDKMVRSVFQTQDGRSHYAQAARTMTRAALTTTLFEAVLHALLKSLGRDKDWEELDDRTKDTYYCIPLPDEHRFLKIPKNREWGAILGTPLMRILEGIDGREDPFKNYIETSLLPNFLPGMPLYLDENGKPKSDIIGFSQALDVAAGRDFANRRIVPYAYESGSKAGQYDGDTSVFSKWLSDAIGNKVGPMEVDFLLKDYFGDFGKLFVRGTSQTRVSGETEESVGDVLADLTWYTPWNVDSRASNHYTTEYYDLMTRLEQETKDMENHAVDDSYKQDPKYQAYSAMKKLYGKEISARNKQAAETLDRDEKGRLKGEVVVLARAAMEFYEDCMSGNISSPTAFATYADRPEELRDELVRLDGLTKDYAFKPTTSSDDTLADTSSLKIGKAHIREYKLDAEAKAKRDELRDQAYNEQLSKVIGSSAYRSASDTEKAEMLEAARQDAYDDAAEDFMKWLQKNRNSTEKGDLPEAFTSLPKSTQKELSRLSGVSGTEKYNYTPSASTTKSYADPDSKNGNSAATREYVLDDAAIAQHNKKRNELYADYVGRVISSSAYRSASDARKAEMLAEARTAAYEDAKEWFMAWLKKNRKSTPKD